MPTTERATWCPTPAFVSASPRCRDDVWKKSRTAASSQAGAFETSTTTSAPARASFRPSPVRVLTPVSGDAASGSWPAPRSFSTSFDPISPVPPITTIFMTFSKDGTHDEHPPARDEMRQVVRQALDVFARLLLEALHFDDLGDQHIIGLTDGLSGQVRRPRKPPIRDRVQRLADDVAILRHQTLKVLGQLRRTQLKP